ncbi:MAG TPA: DinB family protein [Puia sp.]|jgi:uncharacterized damage-inducible protein DinB|nr:DinB family protein [Puia sp.]
MKHTFLTACRFLLFSFAFLSKSYAQALSSEDIKAQLVKEWERAKSYTVEYLNAMPADKYSFKAVDSIRSFAQQMLHLSGGNLFLMSKASPIAIPSWGNSELEKSSTAQSKDSVMYYVTASYDYCINAVKNSDVNKWGEKVKVFGNVEATRFALMLKTFEHQTHHRGQTTIYIRLLGIRPPNERLF